MRPNFTAKQALGISYLPNIRERKPQGSYSELSRLRSPFSKVQQLIVSQSKEVRKQDSGAGEMRGKALNFSRWTFGHFFPKEGGKPLAPLQSCPFTGSKTTHTDVRIEEIKIQILESIKQTLEVQQRTQSLCTCCARLLCFRCGFRGACPTPSLSLSMSLLGSQLACGG